MTGVVEELWRHPVKAMIGERVDRAPVDARGLVGDRLWAVYDEDRKIASGKSSRRFRRYDAVLRLRARTATIVPGEPMVVEVDDPESVPGRAVRAGTAEADAWLSARAGIPLVLRQEAEIRHHDDSPVHLVGTATLAWLAERFGGTPDVRRLRANLLVGTAEPFEEEGWSVVRCGDVELTVGGRAPRCRMLDLVEGRPIADRWLAGVTRERDMHVGIYATATTPGELRSGTPIEVVETLSEDRSR